MDASFYIELFGYLGSAMVIVSMLMASVVKLRIINTAGNVISITYALIIGSYPLAVMNLSLIIINIINLIKLFRPTKHFDLIVGKSDDAYLAYFLKRCKDDIKFHFPEFDRKAIHAEQAYIICCNGNPAGVMLGKEVEPGVLDIALDYTTPTYRDCSVAKYLHKQLPDKGIHTLLSSQSKTEGHVAYLTKMGFAEVNGVYTKTLSNK